MGPPTRLCRGGEKEGPPTQLCSNGVSRWGPQHGFAVVGRAEAPRALMTVYRQSLPEVAERDRRRDVGIGRQERLKIFCPVMGVPVRPRLAVPKIARTSGDFFDLRLDDLRFTIYLRLGFMYDFGLRETSCKPRGNPVKILSWVLKVLISAQASNDRLKPYESLETL